MGNCRLPGIACRHLGSPSIDAGTLNGQCTFSPSLTGLEKYAECELSQKISGLLHILFPLPDKLNTYIKAVSSTFPQKIVSTLSQITAGPRRILALRGYVRKHDLIGSKWAWSNSEAEAFMKTPDYAAAKEAVAAAKSVFASLYPGFTLGTANLIRSLETQITLWNKYDSVLKAGTGLMNDCQKELAMSTYAQNPKTEHVEMFARFLKNHHVNPVPTVATPGLSDHGQLHAIDFIIFEKGKVIASANKSSVGLAWDGSGWTKKLKVALEKANKRFKGPLPVPYEPWHYVFLPEPK